METHSSKELRHFRFICVSFVAHLLGSQRFIRKVSQASEGFIKPGSNHNLILIQHHLTLRMKTEQT